MTIANRKELVDNLQVCLDNVERYQNDMPKVDWAKLHYTQEQHLINLALLSDAVNALVKAVNAPDLGPTFAPFSPHEPSANTAKARAEVEAEEKAARGIPHAPGDAPKSRSAANGHFHREPKEKDKEQTA